MPDERPRKTLGELAAEANGGDGNRCPKCGGALVCYKKLIVGSKIRRYRRCVNRRCDGRFVTRQDFEEIIREVEPYDKDSNAGKSELKIRRESA